MLFLKLSLGCTGLLALFETLFHGAPSFTTTSTTSMVEFSQCLRNDVIRHAFQMGLKSKVILNSTTFHFLNGWPMEKSMSFDSVVTIAAFKSRPPCAKSEIAFS